MKKIFLVLTVLFVQQSFAQQFGVGVAAPSLGANLMFGDEDNFIDMSIISSTSVFDLESNTSEATHFSLFYNNVTSAKTDTWLPFIGFGGMYNYYEFKNSSINKKGFIAALGIAVGTSYKINTNFRTSLAINAGVSLIHKNVKNKLEHSVFLNTVLMKVVFSYVF